MKTAKAGKTVSSCFDQCISDRIDNGQGRTSHWPI